MYTVTSYPKCLQQSLPPDLYGRNFPTAGQMCKQDLWLPVNAQVIDATVRVRVNIEKRGLKFTFSALFRNGWMDSSK